jgi:hypothetical protein
MGTPAFGFLYKQSSESEYAKFTELRCYQTDKKNTETANNDRRKNGNVKNRIVKTDKV